MSQERGKQAQISSAGLHDWFEERMGVDAIWRTVFLRKIPFGVNWLYTLGFAAIAIFTIQAVTGVVLAMYYSPSPDHAYDSVQYVMTELPFGTIIRSIHHAGASAMVVVVVLHMLVVFGMASYKYPRETTWVIGVGLLLLTLGFGFTGYLLPWDEKAYWATTVGTNIAGTIPYIGGILVRVVRGGAGLGTLTLTRFYATHVMLLPMAIVTLIAAHLFLVIRQGVSVPPRLWDRELKKEAKTGTGIASAGYQKLYEYFKMRGRPFFPDLIFEDSVMAVLVTLVVVAVAVTVGAPLESQADPTNTAYIPRPEWYFMFLFQMLKYFPGSVEWVGAVVLPGLFLLIVVALPFFDKRPQRSPRSRPIAILVGILVVAGIVFLTVRAYQTTPPPAPVAEQQAEHLSQTEPTGKELVKVQDYTAYRTMAGEGGKLGTSFVPPLTHEQVADIAQYSLTLN